ncbi:hypothetical protein Tco_1199880 [Tanacetum coccineum]
MRFSYRQTFDGPAVEVKDGIIASAWNLVHRSLTFAEFSSLSGIVPSTADIKYYVELADGKNIEGINCGIVDWYDPPMCARAVKIIPGLLRNMNGLQATVSRYQGQARRLKMMLWISWLVFVLYFLLK